LGEGILNCSNESDCFSQRGDNSKGVKYSEIKKKISPETAGQFQSNLVQIILGERGCTIVKIKDKFLFKGDIITKMQKSDGII
jgi:hypothetical protein